MSGFSLGRSLIDFFFPPRCPLCRSLLTEDPPVGFCRDCLTGIKFLTHPYCSCCGLPFESSTQEDHRCSKCLTEERYFERARSIGFYEGPLAEAISLFKYHGAIHLARPLGNLLMAYSGPGFSFTDYGLILATPSSKERLRERGFNPALLLARRVSSAFSIPLHLHALRRVRHTPPQTRLRGPEREKNIQGAFGVGDTEVIRDKTILLIDDVFTTGATARECAKVLRRAGAKKVDVLTLARA
jgi:ComF family protein